ncbi:putative baseplate assembly protein [Hymenobacter sp. HD11105]
MMTTYACCDELRRNAVKGHPTVNGIDFLEVVDEAGAPFEQRQTTLTVHLLNDLRPEDAAALSAVVEGGDRIRNIRVTALTVPAEPAAPPRILRVTVAEAGDFSTYTLRLVAGGQTTLPPPGFDPVLSAVAFSFKVACPSDFDCEPAACPPPPPAPAPQLNYLAKDYGSFRQLMLDRLALLVPDWQERNPADLGIALVEMLAYVGDHLSYQQDAVGTEAYLNTARKRASVRRHVRLIDYVMHEGSTARVWVQVQVAGTAPVELKQEYDGEKTQFLTQGRDAAASRVMTSGTPAYRAAVEGGAQIFELLHDATLYSQHNEMHFYTWGNTECCLPTGATSAVLENHYPNLKQGQVLIFVEARGPDTGSAHEADPTHRHAVRLTEVSFETDPLGGPDSSSEFGSVGFVAQVTTIRWHPDDALPFPLCLSSRRGTASFANVSVALGNMVLADYGLTVREKKISALVPDTVPDSRLYTPPVAAGHCSDSAKVRVPARYRARLSQGPLTHAVLYDSQNPPASASAAMRWSSSEAQPLITLCEADAHGEPNEALLWRPRPDLLNSRSTAREFVVETEPDGVAWLRFGNDVLGARPAAGTKFRATYRVGNGPRGNVGAGTLVCLATNDTAITLDPLRIVSISNPLPARGGTAPESVEQVRQQAPSAFRRQERAVTPADYEELTRRGDATIQGAACTFRWTGSWRTAFVTVDRMGGQPVDAAFEQQTRARLERYRMAGYDLKVDGPRYEPLELSMEVCVAPNYVASEVKAALLRVFSRGYQPNGRPGLFHPDQFRFGQTVYLSPFYGAAQAVTGVQSVQITAFRRLGSRDPVGLVRGDISLGHLEIARLDNDPNYPDRGLFQLILTGGR